MRRLIAILAGLAIAAPALAADGPRPPTPPPMFSQLLQDVPGKRLVVVRLTLARADPARPRRGHHHPGSVWVYVTEGAALLGIEGQPVQTVHAGESFFEPPGAHHIVAESASATEPARAIAVMIVPDGAPLATIDP